MQANNRISALVLGLFIFLGLSALGYLIGSSAIRFKEFERSVTVKGLSERECDADVVIWPIQFTEAGNDLEALYNSIESSTVKIKNFLEKKGISPEEITVASPAITDKSAQQYAANTKAEFRYTAIQTVTVYKKHRHRARDYEFVIRPGKRGYRFYRRKLPVPNGIHFYKVK